jgi:hypothetical protein
MKVKADGAKDSSLSKEEGGAYSNGVSIYFFSSSNTSYSYYAS